MFLILFILHNITGEFASFLVGNDGNVYEGRGFNVQGAHTSGFNAVSYGTCFIGDFTSQVFSNTLIKA